MGPCNVNIKNAGTRMVVKWMDEEAVKREREKTREKETCQNTMTTVTLNRLHSAGMLLLVIFFFFFFPS